MLVMLIGLTANAQIVAEIETQEELLENSPEFYTEFVNNQRITYVTDSTCNFEMLNINDVPEIRVTRFNSSIESTTIYYYDIDLHLVSIKYSVREGEYTRSINYKL